VWSDFHVRPMSDRGIWNFAQMRNFIQRLKSLLLIREDFDYGEWTEVDSEMGQYLRYGKDSYASCWFLFRDL
jgi:hypothetical protein